MKKVFYSLVFIAFAGLLFSCGGGNIEEQVLGTWKVDKAELENMDEIVKGYEDMLGEPMPEDDKKEMLEDFTSEFGEMEFVFNEDKTLEVSGENGTWKYENEKLFAEIDGDKVEFVVNKLSGNNFNFTIVLEEEIEIRIKLECSKKE